MLIETKFLSEGCQTLHAKPELSAIFLQLHIKYLGKCWMLAVCRKLLRLLHFASDLSATSHSSDTFTCSFPYPLCTQFHCVDADRMSPWIHLQTPEFENPFNELSNLFLTCYDGSDFCCHCMVKMVVMFILARQWRVYRGSMKVYCGEQL